MYIILYPVFNLFLTVMSITGIHRSSIYPAEVNDGYGEYLLVPEGEFLMGDNRNEGGTCELPVHRVFLDVFYIGKYEVTNQEYKKFLDDCGYETLDYWTSDSYGQYGSNPQFWESALHRGGGIAGNDLFPVVGISRYEADAYCKWLSVKTGKTYRLPTEAEWEKTARGTDGRTFPWGEVKPKCDFANLAQTCKMVIRLRLVILLEI